jgi:regulatory protein
VTGDSHRSSRPPKSLTARAIEHLARREYSRAELRDKLLAGTGGAPATREEVDAALDLLVAQGYLSDARFARAIVRQKSGAWAKRAIVGTLKAKGVSSDTAMEALADSEIDDHAALVALWRRRFGNAPANDKEMARQARFLQSRGFALAAILRLLRDPPQN